MSSLKEQPTSGKFYFCDEIADRDPANDYRFLFKADGNVYFYNGIIITRVYESKRSKQVCPVELLGDARVMFAV